MSANEFALCPSCISTIVKQTNNGVHWFPPLILAVFTVPGCLRGTVLYESCLGDYWLAIRETARGEPEIMMTEEPGRGKRKLLSSAVKKKNVSEVRFSGLTDFYHHFLLPSFLRAVPLCMAR